MKKLFTIDDIMIAFIAALGYGFGQTIAQLSGWPQPACIVASLVLGLTLEAIISRIAYSEAVQKSRKNKIITYTACFCIFLVAHAISVVWMGKSMFDYLGEQLVYVIGLPIIGFAFNLFLRGYRARRIRMRYGDGSEGFVFDLKESDIEETNRENHQIHGEYNEDLAVKTRTGIYVGAKFKKTLIYLGIPYAKPPVGDLRWKAPEPLPSSEDVFEAENFGASAIQVDHKGSILKHHRQSEDCLTLNICVSAQQRSTKKPVFVLFHQGDFSSGGTVDPLLYGNNFITNHPEVVFVSFNYRLGIFGFIDFSEVPGGEAYPDTLNLGLLDQIAALQWIKENIAAFGGDPDRITALGFESGASSILLLSVSKKAKGLFNRAFIFNGSAFAAYDTPDVARAFAKDLLKETQTSSMAELMALSTDALKEAAQRLWEDMISPTCDGKLIPMDLFGAFCAGAASGIEFILGIPSNETQVYRAVFGDEKYGEIVSVGVAEIEQYMDPSVKDAMQEYIKVQTASSSELEAKSKVIEQWNALCIYRTALKLVEGKNTVRLLYWAQKPLIESLGSGTVDAMASLLGNGEALEMYGSVMNADVSVALQNLLEKFLSGSDLQLYPNEIKGISAFEWKTFPKAVIVSDEKLFCDTVEDRLTEVDGLLTFMKN